MRLLTSTLMLCTSIFGAEYLNERRAFDLDRIFPNFGNGRNAIRQVILKDGNLYFLVDGPASAVLRTDKEGKQLSITPLGSNMVAAFDVSKDGKHIIVLRNDDKKQLLSTVDLNGKEISVEDVPLVNAPLAAFFSPFGKKLAVSRVGDIAILPNGKANFPATVDGGQLLLDSTDGRIVAIESASGILHVVEMDSMRPVSFKLVSSGLERAIRSVARENEQRRAEGKIGRAQAIGTACASGDNVYAILTGHPVADGFPVAAFSANTGGFQGSANIRFPSSASASGKRLYPVLIQADQNDLVVVDRGHTVVYSLARLGGAQ